MSNYPKIVVTGFGPFGEISENSSSIAIRVLDTKWREISRNPENCLTILADVEVSYRRVDDLTEEIWQNMKPVIFLFTIEKGLMPLSVFKLIDTTNQALTMIYKSSEHASFVL